MKLNSILLRPTEQDKVELLAIKAHNQNRSITESIWNIIHAEYKKILRETNSDELVR